MATFLITRHNDYVNVDHIVFVDHDNVANMPGYLTAHTVDGSAHYIKASVWRDLIAAREIGVLGALL